MKNFKKIFLYLTILALFSSCSKISKKNNEIIFGYSSYYPFYFVDSSSNQPAGFAIDLSKIVAKELKKEARFEFFDMKELLAALNFGKIDVGSLLIKNEKREKNFDFSKIYLEGENCILCRDIESLNNLESLIKEKKKIGVVLGSNADDLVSKSMENNPNLIRFNDFPISFEAFKKKLIDSVIASCITIKSNTKKHLDKDYKIIEIDSNEKIGYAFAYKKNVNKNLKKEIDLILDKLEKNGEIEKLKVKYGLNKEN